jgi:hypothetical protein
MPFYIDASNYTCIHNIITRHDETGVDAVIYRRVLTHKSSIQLQLLLTTRFKRKQSHTHTHTQNTSARGLQYDDKTKYI